MRTRLRMHPYVTRDLTHRVTAHCAAKGITVSAFVEAALEARLDGEAKDNEVIIRDLARLGRALTGLPVAAFPFSSGQIALDVLGVIE